MGEGDSASRPYQGGLPCPPHPSLLPQGEKGLVTLILAFFRQGRSILFSRQGRMGLVTLGESPLPECLVPLILTFSRQGRRDLSPSS